MAGLISEIWHQRPILGFALHTVDSLVQVLSRPHARVSTLSAALRISDCAEFVDDDDPDAEEAEEDLSDSDNDEYATPAGKAQGLGATDEDIAAVSGYADCKLSARARLTVAPQIHQREQSSA